MEIEAIINYTRKLIQKLKKLAAAAASKTKLIVYRCDNDDEFGFDTGLYKKYKSIS